MGKRSRQKAAARAAEAPSVGRSSVAVVAAAAVAVLAAFWAWSAGSREPYIVSAFVPEYRFDHVLSHIGDVAPAVDELMLFSVQPAPDGGVAHDPGLSLAQLARVPELRAAGVRSVRLTVGGGGRSKHFAAVAASKAKRKRFAAELRRLCRDHDLDGIDLNWEASERVKGNKDVHAERFGDLIRDVASELHADGRVLSVTEHHWSQLSARAVAAVDRFQLMAYDIPHESGHASLEVTAGAVRAVTDRVVPKGKVVLGLPAFGRRGYTEIKTYEELMREDDPPEPESDEHNGFFFNGVRTAEAKVRWSSAEGHAGVFLWEAGQDALGTDRSLLRALKRAADEHGHGRGKGEGGGGDA